MTSSQRPEVVECKKLPTCDQNKKEREREEKTLTKHFVPPTERALLLLLLQASSPGGSSERHGWYCVCRAPNPCLQGSGF